jgi:hypothetical protein
MKKRRSATACKPIDIVSSIVNSTTTSHIQELGFKMRNRGCPPFLQYRIAM